MTRLTWLGDEPCHDAAAVGAKAAHLSRLATLHLVPPGFAITAMDAMDAGAGLDAELAADVRRAYRLLAERARSAAPPVAVRSSAIDEDSAGASFAGQHETYLNVRGEEDVIEAVGRCRRSALASVALDYRQRQGLSIERPSIAVLVQQMVESETSAVAFSANPVSGARDQVMVSASWGLGESVVGGTVTPDVFVLQRPGLAIIERVIASKDVMTVFAERGTAEVPVPAEQRDLPSLTHSQLLEIGRLAVRLEHAMGWPVDVECAIAYGELFLLQCRPITALRD